MDFFIRARNSDLDADFIEYLDRFKSYVMDEFGTEEASLLDMVYSDEVQKNSLSDFLENDDPHMGNTLHYMLLRDYEIECGLDSPSSNPGILYSKFEEAREYYSSGNGRASELLTEFGIAGLFNSFHIRSEDIRLDLASIAYEDLASSEYFSYEDDPQIGFMSDYMRMSARMLSINPRRRERIASDILVDMPPIIKVMTQSEFINLTNAEKTEIIDGFLSTMVEMREGEARKIGYDEDEEAESWSDSYDYAMSCSKDVVNCWPVEVIRSCLVAGHSSKEAVEIGSEILTIMLAKLDYDPALIEARVNEVVRSALLPFPKSYQDIFKEDMPDFRDVFSPNKPSNNGFSSWNEVGINLNSSSSRFGMPVNIIKLINEYGDHADGIISNLIKALSVSKEALADICIRSSALRTGQAEEIISAWIDDIVLRASNLDRRIPFGDQDQGISALSPAMFLGKGIIDLFLRNLAEIGVHIRGIGSDELNLKINNTAFDFIVDEGVLDAGDFKFIFSNESEKMDFIKNKLTESANINSAIVRAGDFSQKDLACHWKKLSPQTRKIIVVDEFGL